MIRQTLGQTPGQSPGQTLDRGLSQSLRRTLLRWLPWLGALQLAATSLLYSYFGISAFPRPEWLVELLVACICVLAVLGLFQCLGESGDWKTLSPRWKAAARTLGLILLLHSLWDCLHWPLLSWVDTPVDPRLPQTCPYLDIPIGVLLLLTAF